MNANLYDINKKKKRCLNCGGIFMDLRIERTRKCIRNAFIELRKTKPIEKITIKELAALASINKATFYSHYNDIYDLSEQIENEIIASIIHSIPHIESLISNPTVAVEELTVTSTKNKFLTDILFSGSREGLFAIKLEKGIKDQIFNQYPEFKNNFQWNLVLTFLIQGALHSYSSYYLINEKDTRKTIGELHECIKNHFLNE